MTLAGLYRLDLDEPLPIGGIELTHDRPEGSHDRCHGHGQPIEPSSRVLAIPDVMHTGIPNGTRFGHIVELSVVIGQQRVIPPPAGIPQQDWIFLSLPTKGLNVVDLMLREQATKRFHQLDGNVLVKQ